MVSMVDPVGMVVFKRVRLYLVGDVYLLFGIYCLGIIHCFDLCDLFSSVRCIYVRCLCTTLICL
jgi:hypothetical protein